MVEIIQSDVLEWCRTYTGPPAHACLCDPPYEMNFMGSGKTDYWDNTGIAFRPETWAALAKHLHPGAFVMAFAGTRGYHRMACALEDAGLILHPMIVWLFGSGFPKSTRIDTQIDKAAGAEREVIGANPNNRKNRNKQNGIVLQTYRDRSVIDIPATDLARAWAGHRYGLQCLKPALECIAVAQVPYRGRPVDCITQTGAGSLNVDGARIGNGCNRDSGGLAKCKSMFQSGNQMARPINGRWPSNLLLDDSPEVAAMFPQTQSGKMLSKHNRNGSQSWFTGDAINETPGDEGSAARFYFQSDWQYEVFEAIEQANPGFYCAKAGRRERDSGLEQNVKLPNAGKRTLSGGLDTRGRPETTIRNHHPTVKPLRLTRYLATLLLPPAAYAPRRLLQPFSGSGSEAIGAALAGWEEIVGIEQSPEYCELARARAAWWVGHVGLFEQITAEGEEAESQLCLL